MKNKYDFPDDETMWKLGWVRRADVLLLKSDILKATTNAAVYGEQTTIESPNGECEMRITPTE